MDTSITTILLAPRFTFSLLISYLTLTKRIPLTSNNLSSLYKILHSGWQLRDPLFSESLCDTLAHIQLLVLAQTILRTDLHTLFVTLLTSSDTSSQPCCVRSPSFKLYSLYFACLHKLSILIHWNIPKKITFRLNFLQLIKRSNVYIFYSAPKNIEYLSV